MFTRSLRLSFLIMAGALLTFTQTGTPATQQQKSPANPCKSTPEYRQFDFCVGEWLPQNKAGKTVGASSIELILGNCVILENWDTPVVSGKSFSMYDSTDRKWHKSWVSDRGVRTEYKGGLVEGKMVLVATTVLGGKETFLRMTYSQLPNGDVR
jgi:hypothetical protein